MTAGQSKTGWEAAIEDRAARAEAEARRVVAYLNDEIVPEIRRDSSRALQAMAERLTYLAERLEGRRSTSRAGSTAKPGWRTAEAPWTAEASWNPETPWNPDRR